MIDYDTEAARYDATRGGDARADAAADAVGALLPASAALVVDVAGGTGIVSTRLCRAGRRVVVVDRSAAMAAVAATRLPGDVVLGDATDLPFAGAGVDAVTCVWLLHLLDEPTSAAVVAEAARVLRPGGALVTTVDKTAAHYTVDDDVSDVLGDTWRSVAGPAADGSARIAGLAASHGLVPAGETGFTGVGQGRSPRQWQRHVAEPANGWSRACGPDAVAAVCRALAALPDADRRRADPRYRVVSFTRPV